VAVTKGFKSHFVFHRILMTACGPRWPRTTRRLIITIVEYTLKWQHQLTITVSFTTSCEKKTC